MIKVNVSPLIHNPKKKKKNCLSLFLCFGAVVDLSGTLLQMFDVNYEKLGEIYLSDCNQNIR